MQHDMITARVSSCTHFTVIMFNSKAINDRNTTHVPCHNRFKEQNLDKTKSCIPSKYKMYTKFLTLSLS